MFRSLLDTTSSALSEWPDLSKVTDKTLTSEQFLMRKEDTA